MQAPTRLRLPALGGPALNKAEPLLRIDESALKRVLAMNPALGQGRTVHEFKEHLEAGGGMSPSVAKTITATLPLEDELEASFSHFLQAQLRTFHTEFTKLQEEKAALTRREEALKQQARKKLASFLTLMDLQAVRAYGRPVLEKFSSHLAQLETSPSKLLNTILSARS